HGVRRATWLANDFEDHNAAERDPVHLEAITPGGPVAAAGRNVEPPPRVSCGHPQFPVSVRQDEELDRPASVKAAPTDEDRTAITGSKGPESLHPVPAPADLAALEVHDAATIGWWVAEAEHNVGGAGPQREAGMRRGASALAARAGRARAQVRDVQRPVEGLPNRRWRRRTG